MRKPVPARKIIQFKKPLLPPMSDRSKERAKTVLIIVLAISGMLGRFGSAKTTMPGGCNFGVRPIDQHIKGMTALGAEVDVRNGFVYAQAPDGKLHGGRIYRDKVSVGATMNIMLAAAMAQGRTIIENAAREPHIVDLANFLNSMLFSLLFFRGFLAVTLSW